MHNKPQFSLLKNVGYALAGMRSTIAHEKSFRTQLSVIAVLAVGLFFMPISAISKWILFASTWLVLIAEAFNSAIERVVDLVTQQEHPLAKEAKDIGAFGVLLAFCLTVLIWGIVLYQELA